MLCSVSGLYQRSISPPSRFLPYHALPAPGLAGLATGLLILLSSDNGPWKSVVWPFLAPLPPATSGLTLVSCSPPEVIVPVIPEACPCGRKPLGGWGFYCLWPHGLCPTRLLCPWNFLWQEYWSELPIASPGDLPNPGIKPQGPELQIDSLPLSQRIAQFMQAECEDLGDEAGPSPLSPSVSLSVKVPSSPNIWWFSGA